VEVVVSLSQGRTAAAQCGLFTHKSVPVIFEPPCISSVIQQQPMYSFFRNLFYFRKCFGVSWKNVTSLPFVKLTFINYTVKPAWLIAVDVLLMFSEKRPFHTSSLATHLLHHPDYLQRLNSFPLKDIKGTLFWNVVIFVLKFKKMDKI